jgi:hypothetical protein
VEYYQLIPRSLTRLLEGYQSRRLLKGKVRMSNWELPLSPQQVNCTSSSTTNILHVFDRLRADAASDALAGFVVHQHLANLNSRVPAGNYTSDFLAGKKQPMTKGQTHPSQSSYAIASVSTTSNPPVPAFPALC